MRFNIFGLIRANFSSFISYFIEPEKNVFKMDRYYF